jgi:hypothetical protein
MRRKNVRYRERMRRAFWAAVTVEEWQNCVAALLKAAKDGNVTAYKLLEPWVMGKPDSLEVPEADPLEIVIKRE